jgi:hypothetical protein
MVMPGSESGSFLAERPIRTSCTTTPLLEAASLLQSAPNGRPAFGWLTLSRSRRGDIEDVFPQTASLSKVDHHGRLLTPLVEEELHATNHVSDSEGRCFARGSRQAAGFGPTLLIVSWGFPRFGRRIGDQSICRQSSPPVTRHVAMGPCRVSSPESREAIMPLADCRQPYHSSATRPCIDRRHPIRRKRPTCCSSAAGSCRRAWRRCSRNSSRG